MCIRNAQAPHLPVSPLLGAVIWGLCAGLASPLSSITNFQWIGRAADKKRRGVNNRHGVGTTWSMQKLSLVNDVCATVFSVISFGVTQGFWTLFTKAHSFDLAVAYAQQTQHACHGVGTTLTQSQVVLGTTTLVGSIINDGSITIEKLASDEGARVPVANATLFSHSPDRLLAPPIAMPEPKVV